MLAGSDTYSVKATFQTAGQLVNGNEVQIGGKPVGKVTAIELTENGQAEVEMEVDSDFKPLHEGTKAVVRVGSLSGIAGRYVSLTPGPNDAEEIDDGGHDRRGRDHDARGPRPALQHARPEDPEGPPADRPGRRDPVRRQGRGGQRGGQVLQPRALDRIAADRAS